MAKEAGSASERLPLLSGQIQGQNTESLDTLLGTPAYADESSPDGGAPPGSRRSAWPLTQPRRAAAVGATTCGFPRNLMNILTMACGYLCLFTAFQTTQILSSRARSPAFCVGRSLCSPACLWRACAAVLGHIGSLSISILYFFFVLFGFFAPAVARHLGPVKGLMVGGCTHPQPSAAAPRRIG